MSSPEDYEQRLSALEERVLKLEEPEPEPPRPGHNIRGAYDSAQAELDANAYHRLIESKAGW